MNPIIIPLAVVAMGIIMVGLMNPKILAWMILPAIMMYPSRLTYGMLPLNAGFEDLLIVYVFILFLIHGQIRHTGWIGKMMLIFGGIMLIGEATALVLGTDIEYQIKYLLKQAILVFTILILYNAVETPRDWRFLILSISIALVGGATISFFDGLGQSWPRMFMGPETEEHAITHYRATGPFLSPQQAGLSMMVMIVWFGWLFFQKTAKMQTRILIGAAVILFSGTFVLTGTRSGLTGVGGAAFVAILMSRHRAKLLLFLAGLTMFAVLTPAFREIISRRAMNTVVQSSEGIFEATGRLDTYTSAIKRAFGPWTFFCGTGFSRYVIREPGMRQLSHNMILSIILPWGLAGVFWYIAVAKRIIQLGKWVKTRTTDPLYLGTAEAWPWLVLCLFISGISSDVVTMQSLLTLIYAIAILIEKSSVFINHETQWHAWVASQIPYQNQANAKPVGTL